MQHGLTTGNGKGHDTAVCRLSDQIERIFILPFSNHGMIILCIKTMQAVTVASSRDHKIHLWKMPVGIRLIG